MKLSVIIPTLNEEICIARTLEEVCSKARPGNPHEVIVVDTGSTDGTTGIVSGLAGVKLLQPEDCAPGRGQGLNIGSNHATGDALLFLDADTSPPEGYDEAIENALADPNVVGGAFEFALDGTDFIFRVIEAINRVHYRLLKLYHGDQGMFVRAGLFREIGGFPQHRILESYYLCRLLKQRGKLALITKEMRTSPRRFTEGGVYRVIAKDLQIWLIDFMGWSVDRFADHYWEDNKKRGKSAPE